MLKKVLFLAIIAFSVAFAGCGGDKDKKIEVTSVTVSPTEATLTAIGETVTLEATVLPENATDKSVVWSSGNETVATVDATRGVVTATGEGKTEIWVIADGKIGKANITVTIDKKVEVTSVSISRTEIKLVRVGETVALEATVLPENATDKQVVWSSDNDAVASVDAASGIVTAVSEGVAEIRATAGGKSGKTTITVALEKPTGSAKVYAVGTDRTADGSQFATLWVDGETRRLSINRGSYAGGVYVDESDNVYAVGWDVVGGSFLPALWVNEDKVQLLEKSGYGEVYSVFVDGEDVYVAGCYDAGGSGLELRAAFWKNGVRQEITATDGYATSVYVVGEDVYVAYWRQNLSGTAYQACLWHNGTETVLSSAYSEAWSVTVHNGDVYVAGREHIEGTLFCATLWKNGVKQYLSDEFSYARSVVVDGDDVYVSGLDGNGSYNTASKAVYWKNGEVHNLTDGTVSADANAVFVLDGDVYVGGYDTPNFDSYDIQHAKVWKNGQPTQLSDNQSRVNGLYVK
jgi:hypothetical protein